VTLRTLGTRPAVLRPYRQIAAHPLTISIRTSIWPQTPTSRVGRRSNGRSRRRQVEAGNFPESVGRRRVLHLQKSKRRGLVWRHPAFLQQAVKDSHRRADVPGALDIKGVGHEFGFGI
jgi:hypothetical protein